MIARTLADLNLSSLLATAIALSLYDGQHEDALKMLMGAFTKAPLNTAVLSAISIVSNMRNANLLTEQLNKNAYAILQAAAPIQAYVSADAMLNESGHSHPHYHLWRTKRLTKLMGLAGSDLTGKSVLVLGDGPGVIGGFIAALGANVTALEGREPNCTLANLRYSRGFSYQYVSKCSDLNKDFSRAGRFDLIVAFGVLEVIKEVDLFIASCAACSDEIFLETLVCDSIVPTKIKTTYPKLSNDNPLDNVAYVPSPAYIERAFEMLNFSNEQHFDEALNTPSHTYNWVHKNTGEMNSRYRRFWSFTKRPSIATTLAPRPSSP